MADTGSTSKSWADIQDEEDRAAASATAATAGDKATEEITEGLAEATTQDPNAPLQIRLKTLSQDFFGEDEIEVFNSNPNSPLYSAKTFEELNLAEPLIKGVYALGFEKPSKIQEKALPLILSNPPQNLIAQAQSGTGKTAAFTLGMLSRVDISKKVPQAICVSPIRELARQIATNVEAMGKFVTGLEVGLAIPSDNKFEKSRERLTSHVIIGTPGTLCSMLQQRTLDSRNIKVLVMDEADELLAGGNLREQTKRLQQLLPPSTQTLCFSATYHPEVFKVAEGIVRGKNNRPYSKITLKVTELSLETVKQYYINVGDESKKYEVLSMIFGFIKVGGQTLIFVNTRAKAKELVTNLRKDNHTVNLLTAEMEPTERDAVIDEYRTGKTKILISTNVLARGIDILQIALVINYDVPVVQVPGRHKGEADAETYLHRCGRSARYGRPGVVINFVSDAKSLAIVKSLEALLKREIAEMKVEEIPDLEDVMKKIRKN